MAFSNESRFLRLVLSLALACLTFMGCASTRAPKMTGRSLVEYDESWARAAASNDLDEFMDFWTEHAVLYLPNAPPFHGKAAIREMIERSRTIAMINVSWTPCCSGIDANGTMAYTLGEGKSIYPSESGTAHEYTGRYVAIWQRESDRWRCAVMSWTPSPRADQLGR